MKKFTFFLLLLFPFLAFGQDEQIPEAVTNSFAKIFPGATIKSWTDNGHYDYLTDWNNDAYFGDFNFDGLPDDYFYGDGFYYDGYGDGFYDQPFYYDNGLDNDLYVPEDYVIVHTLPNQFQLNFVYKGTRMSGIFKTDGTFVIAKGRVTMVPKAVTEAVKNAFKGEVIRLAQYKEIMITPKYPVSDPVYRVKVYAKHNGSAILKIDSKGTVISNDPR